MIDDITMLPADLRFTRPYISALGGSPCKVQHSSVVQKSAHCATRASRQQGLHEACTLMWIYARVLHAQNNNVQPAVNI